MTRLTSVRRWLVLGMILATATAAAVQAAEEEPGFVSLFNGENFEGWIGDTKGYVVKDGAIQSTPQCRNLLTEKEYDNFVLRFEFKLTPGANNGLGIRTPTEGNLSYDGMELQILDDTHEKYKSIETWQHHGSIYGVAAAKPGHLKPVGEWNAQEVIADGTKIKVILNGETIVDHDLQTNLDSGKTADGKGLKDHAGASRAGGHIGFLGHGDVIEVRNIRIKELK